MLARDVTERIVSVDVLSSPWVAVSVFVSLFGCVLMDVWVDFVEMLCLCFWEVDVFFGLCKVECKDLFVSVQICAFDVQ